MLPIISHVVQGVVFFLVAATSVGSCMGTFCRLYLMSRGRSSSSQQLPVIAPVLPPTCTLNVHGNQNVNVFTAAAHQHQPPVAAAPLVASPPAPHRFPITGTPFWRAALQVSSDHIDSDSSDVDAYCRC